MTDHEKILSKIKKCLALSASSNEHEAAAALRQARKLMEEHNISELDVEASAAAESSAKAGAKKTPSNWETMLASKIASAFGCQIVFGYDWRRDCGLWKFIGCGTAPEIAQYAYAVLYRQAVKARTAHIHDRLKRCKTATKTQRADLFSQGWVQAVTGKISAYAGTDQQAAAIAAFKATCYPSLTTMNSRDRNADRNLKDHEYGDLLHGHAAGKNAELNRGVGANAAPLALE